MDYAMNAPRPRAAPKQNTPPALELLTNPDALPPVRLLLADSDAATRERYAVALRAEGYEVFTTATGLEALDYLRQAPFDAVLTELYLPDRSGLDLLRDALALDAELPVIFVTARASVELARQALTQGASDFIAKPCPESDLPLVVERSLTRQAMQRRSALRNKLALQTSNESVLDALFSALNSRDTETPGHSERVTAYTMEIADRLHLAPAELHPIERGALLHDIGKIGIPDRILLKPDKLTPEEWIEVKKHPVIGHQMCARIEMLSAAAQIVLHHHEAWNGSGYPHGVSGAKIPLGARIFAIADTLDSITTDRPYRAARSFEVALAEIERCSGTQFDPEIVRVFQSIPLSRLQQIHALADR